uniref:SGNH/GDSL hydrolase family protein n=1 Tax=Empedobacter brevis TaxID=247 RepID=UPI0039AF20E4
QTGVDVLSPTGEDLPKEKAVAVYIEENAVSPVLIGLNRINKNESIFKFDNFNDQNQWKSNTVVLKDANTANSNGWKTTRRKITVGIHKTNLYLTDLVYFHTLDSDGKIVQSFSKQGVYAGTTEWEFTTSPNEVEIILCVRNGQLDSNYSGFLYLTTPEAYENLTDEIFIKRDGSENLLDSIRAKTAPYLLNPKRNNFDYRAIQNIELVNPIEAKLKNAEGEWLRLFISFIRILEIDNVSSTIVQISKYNETSNSTGVNDISVSTFIGSDNQKVVDKNGYINVNLTEVSSSGINMRILLDTKYLVKSIDTNISLSDTLELNTAYLFASSIQQNKSVSKNGAYLGDSTVEFGTIPTQVGSLLGYDIKNCGVGGTRMAVHTLSDYKDLSFYKIAEAINSGDWSIIKTALDNLIYQTSDTAKAQRLTTTKNNLINTDWSKIDFIVIQYGTNDFTGGNDIGLIDKSNLDVTTLIGALNYGIKQILLKYPKIKLYFITPTHRYMEASLKNDSDTYTNVLGKKLIDYVDAIKSASNQNFSPVKDMYRESGFSQYNHSIYFVDGVHPNVAGYKLFSEQVAAFIRSCIM